MEKGKGLLDGMICGMCAHDCPLTNPSCRRGQDYAAQVYQSKMEYLERCNGEPVEEKK